MRCCQRSAVAANHDAASAAPSATMSNTTSRPSRSAVHQTCVGEDPDVFGDRLAGDRQSRRRARSRSADRARSAARGSVAWSGRRARRAPRSGLPRRPPLRGARQHAGTCRHVDDFSLASAALVHWALDDREMCAAPDRPQVELDDRRRLGGRRPPEHQPAFVVDLLDHDGARRATSPILRPGSRVNSTGRPTTHPSTRSVRRHTSDGSASNSVSTRNSVWSGVMSWSSTTCNLSVAPAASGR